MTSIEELRALLAGLGQQSRYDAAATTDAIRALCKCWVISFVENVGAGAAPPVLALQRATQTVRKSSETTVHLSLSDDEYDSRHQRVMRPPTQNAIRQLTLAVSNLAANVGAVPGAASPVFLQAVRKPYDRFDPLHIDRLVEKRRLAMQQKNDDALTTNDAIRAMAATVGRLMMQAKNIS